MGAILRLFASQRWCSLTIPVLLATIVFGQSSVQRTSSAPSNTDTTVPPARVQTSVFPAQTVIRPTRTDEEHPTETPYADPSMVVLGPGDLLQVNVYGVPELGTKVRVSNSGDAYLPLVDYVHVGDLKLEEAQALIEKRLADGRFVNNPHVTLFVEEYSSNAVALLGEVNKPGVYPILGERRLFEVISAAGGFTDKAGKAVTIVHRRDPDRPLTIRLAQHMEQGTAENVEVSPGDTIVVAKAGLVYVVGDVGRPSGFVMQSDSITILQALAIAGGANKTAKLNGARIIRETAQGTEEKTIPLKKILQGNTADLPMQANDILFVPSSAAKSALYRSRDAVVQAATGLAIVSYRP